MAPIWAAMSKPSPARYRTTNWPKYDASLRRRGPLLVWLDREMEWSALKRGCPGRPRTFSDAAEIHTRIALMNRFSALGRAEITRAA